MDASETVGNVNCSYANGLMDEKYEGNWWGGGWFENGVSVKNEHCQE